MKMFVQQALLLGFKAVCSLFPFPDILQIFFGNDLDRKPGDAHGLGRVGQDHGAAFACRGRVEGLGNAYRIGLNGDAVFPVLEGAPVFRVESTGHARGHIYPQRVITGFPWKDPLEAGAGDLDRGQGFAFFQRSGLLDAAGIDLCVICFIIVFRGSPCGCGLEFTTEGRFRGMMDMDRRLVYGRLIGRAGIAGLDG